MRHRVGGKKLNRSSNHRKALFKNVASGLIEHGEITTTEAKAKAIQATVEKLVTKAKKQTLHSRRLIHSFLNDKKLTSKLVDKLAPQLGHRSSGFTKIQKLGVRRGDNATMVKLSLVDKVAMIEVAEPTVEVKKEKKATSSAK